MNKKAQANTLAPWQVIAIIIVIVALGLALGHIAEKYNIATLFFN